MRFIALAAALAGFSLAFASSAHAQTYTVLHNFCSQAECADGEQPGFGLIQAPNGNLYGTTDKGGAKAGTLYEIDTAGTLSTLYNFCLQANCPDGWFGATLVRGSNGDLYGTTDDGGANHAGTAFSFDASGYSTLANLTRGSSGSANPSKLIQASDKAFYGTLASGGAHRHGSVFKMTPSGALTTLHNFCNQPNCADGELPNGGVIQASDGYLYGVTAGAVATAFRISTTGSYEVLHTFGKSAGQAPPDPRGPLIQGTDGNLYGTTSGGGANGYGAVYRMTTAGAVTILYNFVNQEDPNGAQPTGALIQASDGNLYGATEYPNLGIIYRLTLDGVITPVHQFCGEANCIDGYYSSTPLQATDGKLYGVTSQGGACATHQCGVVYSLDLGLAAPND